MQIDGHHTGTYVCARAAGFTHDEAATISYAAQYVDDATNDGAICFADSEYMYSRIASAHKMLDACNFSDVDDNLSWLPFHFLPGNGGKQCDSPATLQELDKLVCCPDSPVARDMLRCAVLDRNTPRGLHRLGIAMHVYADTFAHQGFVGSLCVANKANQVTSNDPELDERIRSCSKKDILQQIKTGGKALWLCASQTIRLMAKERKNPIVFIVDFWKNEPVGHAAVDTFPDQPYLAWQYTNWKGVTVTRDNTLIFLDAFDCMTRAMNAWRAGDNDMDLERHAGLTDLQKGQIRQLILSSQDPDGFVRHKNWLTAIQDGHFFFGKQNLNYLDKGEGSWKQKALQTTRDTDTGFEKFPYSTEFLKSDWKYFHDALQVHRSNVLHEVLPAYEICAG